MRPSFQREGIHTLWPEIWPLLIAHWQEIATWKDIPFDPNTEAYEALEQARMLYVFTARVDAELVGYAAYIVRTHLHYQSSTQAYQDVLYLAPEHRRGGTGRELIEFADQELAKEEVQVVYQHTKTAQDFGPLLERIGYTLVEKVYARRV